MNIELHNNLNVSHSMADLLFTSQLTFRTIPKEACMDIEIDSRSLEYSKMHNKILEACKIEDPSEYLAKIKDILKSSKQLKYDSDNCLKNSIPKLNMDSINKTSKEFISYLKNLDQDQLKDFNKGDINSLFLTLIGVRSGCVIDSKMAKCILDSNNEIFNNINGITNENVVNNTTLSYIYNFPESLKVINNNLDFFPKINNEKKFIEYIKKNNLTMTNSFLSRKCSKEELYNKHVRTGLLLGFPKPIVMNFATLHHVLDKFYAATKTYEINEDENIELGKMLKRNDVNGYFKLYAEYAKSAKIRNFEKHNRIMENWEPFTPSEIIPKEAFEFLAGYDMVTLPGTIYLVYEQMNVSENFKKLINYIYEQTEFENQIPRIY